MFGEKLHSLIANRKRESEACTIGDSDSIPCFGPFKAHSINTDRGGRILDVAKTFGAQPAKNVCEQ
jgi:hypothetical protein